MSKHTLSKARRVLSLAGSGEGVRVEHASPIIADNADPSRRRLGEAGLWNALELDDGAAHVAGGRWPELSGTSRQGRRGRGQEVKDYTQDDESQCVTKN